MSLSARNLLRGPILAFAFPFRRLAPLNPALLLVVPALLVAVPRAMAQQEPEIYDAHTYAYGQWDIGRQLNQSEFRYCVDPLDPSWQKDGEIAYAIAQDLLLQLKSYVVASEFVLEDLSKV